MYKPFRLFTDPSTFYNEPNNSKDKSREHEFPDIPNLIFFLFLFQNVESRIWNIISFDTLPYVLKLLGR